MQLDKHGINEILVPVNVMVASKIKTNDTKVKVQTPGYLNSGSKYDYFLPLHVLVFFLLFFLIYACTYMYIHISSELAGKVKVQLNIKKVARLAFHLSLDGRKSGYPKVPHFFLSINMEITVI